MERVRFARWADRGWELMHQHFADDPDLECLIIDSTVVRAHPCAAGAPPKKVARQPRPWAGAAAGLKVHVSVEGRIGSLRPMLSITESVIAARGQSPGLRHVRPLPTVRQPGQDSFLQFTAALIWLR